MKKMEMEHQPGLELKLKKFSQIIVAFSRFSTVRDRKMLKYSGHEIFEPKTGARWTC